MMKHRKQSWILVCLTLVTIALSLLGWYSRSLAQSPLTLQTAGLTLEKVGLGIYTLVASTDYPSKDIKTTAICNAGIILSDDGVLVIDPFQNEALGNLLLSTVAEISDQPVRYVLNTHYHFDHTGGNAAFMTKQIPIIGRGPIRERMLEKNRELDPNLTTPTVIVNSNSNLWLGDRQVIIEQVEGHSSGTDLVAYVPDADILFTGDILFHQRIPYVSDGNIRQWQETLSQLMTQYPNAKIVPGHGVVTDRTGLEALKTYFDDLEQLALSWKEQGLSQEQAVKMSSEIPTAYQNYKFQGLYPGNLETAYQQITLSE